MKLTLLVIFCFFVAAAQAQNFMITKTEMSDGNLILYYNLIDSVANRNYTIHVYSSVDNFISPLVQVSGDVGREVKSGINRKIIWNAKQELGGAFGGDVSLEIRGEILLPFVELNGFEHHRVFKRLRNYPITWTSKAGGNALNFDLYRGEKKVSTFQNVSNVGQYSLRFDDKVRPGSDYKLKISDPKNINDVVWTDNFSIKRKTPLLLKLIPFVGLAYLATTISHKSGSHDIVDPPKPD